MCNCCEPKFLGCVGTCESVIIADAPETGVYELKLEFSGTSVTVTSEAVANVGDNIVFSDLTNLNEFYTYKGTLIAPSGTPVTPADHDCISFRTQIGGGALSVTL